MFMVKQKVGWMPVNQVQATGPSMSAAQLILSNKMYWLFKSVTRYEYYFRFCNSEIKYQVNKV